MKLYPKTLTAALLVFMLAGCGSSSNGSDNSGINVESANYTGLTTAAKFEDLDEEQKETLGTASAQIIAEAVDIGIDDLPFSIAAHSPQPTAHNQQ